VAFRRSWSHRIECNLPCRPVFCDPQNRISDHAPAGEIKTNGNDSKFVKFDSCRQPSIITLMFYGITHSGAYWRESTIGLQFYCGCLPMKCLIEQQTILFYRRILRGSSPILHILLQLKQGFVSSLLVKYNIPFLGCPKHVIKSRIWDSFLTRVKNYGYVDYY